MRAWTIVCAASVYALIVGATLRAQRFDEVVREDFFAGMTGERAASIER